MEGLDFLRDHIGPRPCWLAASTHSGEEALIGRVHLALKNIYPELITIIVPRHPDRGEAIAKALSADHLPSCAGVAAMQLSRQPTFIWPIRSESWAFFRLSPISFMGKSLVDREVKTPWSRSPGQRRTFRTTHVEFRRYLPAPY